MKFLLFCLLVVLLIIGIAIAIGLNQPKDINHNNVTIRGQDYNAIKEMFNDSQIVRVCNLENYNCIDLIKMDVLG